MQKHEKIISIQQQMIDIQQKQILLSEKNNNEYKIRLDKLEKLIKKNLWMMDSQEVKQLFPQMVEVIQDTSWSDEGITDIHAINYTGFSVLAIKAIQE